MAEESGITALLNKISRSKSSVSQCYWQRGRLLIAQRTSLLRALAKFLRRQSELDAGGERVTIIGDDVGDSLRFWSEGQTVCLPYSKYCLHFTDGLWDLANGCAEHPACYGDKFQTRVASLKPDYYAPLTVKALREARDPAMETVSRLIHQH